MMALTGQLPYPVLERVMHVEYSTMRLDAEWMPGENVIPA